MSGSREIDAAKVEAICNALKAALPELVAIAFAAFKKTDEFAVGKLVTTLSDAEWRKVKRNEDRRRRCKRQRETTNGITGSSIDFAKERCPRFSWQPAGLRSFNRR